MIPVAFAGFGGATFSDDARHRYGLWRQIHHEQQRPLKRALFVMLNPSTADHRTDDPTIRRCIGFAKSWRCTVLEVANLFSLRSTDPGVLYGDPQAEGDPENITSLVGVTRTADIVVCAWGVHGALRGRGTFVHETLRVAGVKLHHLGLTKGGHPRHPLYLPKTITPVEWT